MSKGKVSVYAVIALALGFSAWEYFKERNTEYVPVDVADVCESSFEEGHYELSGVPGSVSLDLSENRSRIAVVLGCEDGVVSAYSSESGSYRERYLQAETLINYYIDRDDSTKINLRGKLEKDGTFKFKLPRNLEDLFN